MSNRQARREQARTSRAPQTKRPSGGKPSSGGSSGSGSSIFSKGFLIAIAAFVVVAIGIGVAVVLFNESDSEELATLIEEGTANLPLDMADGAKLGNDDAAVKMVSYEDFQCPFCLRYTAEIEPGLIDQLVKTGEVQMEFRHLPILRNESVTAALASQCAADQNKFWPYHHRLFLTQAEAGQAENEELNVGRFSDTNLKNYATDLGLDRAVFDDCLDSRKHLDLITQHGREANEFGITGTPGFTLNGQPLTQGAPSTVEDWVELIRNFADQQATATANATLTPATTASPAASPAVTTSPAASPSGTAAATTTTPAASQTPAPTATP
jgi:protein-disulfide isomerase